MAVELTTNSQRINYSEWNATGQGYWLYTAQYVYYEMLNSTTARVHVTQVVGSVSGQGWEGTNNHYRSRTSDWSRMDSGYKSFGTISANTEMTLWSGYYDITSSEVVTLVCYADAYGGTYSTEPMTDVFVPASAFAVAPATPTVSVDSVSSDSVSLTYGTTSFGNPPTGTVTLFGGTSSSPTTTIDTYNSTGNKTFTFSILNPATTYYFRAVASNGTLSSNYSTEVSATTLQAMKLYGSVNNKTKQIQKLYGSVNGKTKRIDKLYCSVGGVTKRIL